MVVAEGRHVLGSSAWGLADQALVSATNFLTVVILARTLSPHSFGSFSLIYAILFFANGLQLVLIVQPLNTLMAASRGGPVLLSYTTTTAICQLIFAAGIAGLLAIGALVAWTWGYPIGSLVLAGAVAAFAWQMQEFFRRLFYVRRQIGRALLNDVISYGGQAVAVIALWRVQRLTGVAAFHVIWISSAAAAAVAAWQVRGLLSGSFDWKQFQANWSLGKWLTAAAGYWLSFQLYIYLTAINLGLPAVGALRACQAIFGPLNTAYVSADNVLSISFARTFIGDGAEALRWVVARVHLIGAPVAAMYCIAVATFGRQILEALYGHNYRGQTSLVALLSGYFFMIFPATILSGALRAERRTQPMFVAYAVASVVSLASGWWLMRWLGLNGAGLGMILGVLALNIILAVSYFSARATGNLVHSVPTIS